MLTGMTLRVDLHDRRRPHVIAAALPWELARARPCTAAVARLPIRHPQSSGLGRDISNLPGSEQYQAKDQHHFKQH